MRAERATRRTADAGWHAVHAHARGARSAARRRRGRQGVGLGPYGPHRRSERHGGVGERVPRHLRAGTHEVSSMKSGRFAAGAMALPALLVLSFAADVKPPLGLPPFASPADNPYSPAKAELGRYL